LLLANIGAGKLGLHGVEQSSIENGFPLAKVHRAAMDDLADVEPGLGEGGQGGRHLTICRQTLLRAR
jgi:hypothetical protein